MGMLLRRHRKQEEPEQSETNLEELTKDEIRSRLDELDIDYKSSDNKETLISLLKSNEEA